MSDSSYSPLIVDQSLEGSETESLKNSMRYHVKYGSTGNDHKSINKYKYITHLVQPTDTLQGLALRYEVTMEQIKRANNLWSSDNLSLRSRTIITIPVLMSETTIESPLYSSSSNTSSQTTSPKESELNNGSHSSVTANHSSLESVDIHEISLDDNRDNKQSSHGFNSNQMHSNESKTKNGFKLFVSSDGQSNHLDSYDTNEDTDESAADFLIRIDSSIAKSKDKVKVMQQNRLSGTHSDDDLFRLNHSAQHSGLRRHNSSTSRPHSSNCSSLSQRQTQSDFPQPLVMMTHKRKVKSSLKRLEKTQDEIFEL